MSNRIASLSLRTPRALGMLALGLVAGATLNTLMPDARADAHTRANVITKCEMEWIKYLEDVANGVPTTEPNCTPGPISTVTQQHLGYATLLVTVYEPES